MLIFDQKSIPSSHIYSFLIFFHRNIPRNGASIHILDMLVCRKRKTWKVSFNYQWTSTIGLRDLCDMFFFIIQRCLLLFLLSVCSYFQNRYCQVMTIKFSSSLLYVWCDVEQVSFVNLHLSACILFGWSSFSFALCNTIIRAWFFAFENHRYHCEETNEIPVYLIVAIDIFLIFIMSNWHT